MNDLILSLDTTHEFGSIALLQGAQIIDEISLHSPDGFGHILFGHLERVLDRNAVLAPDASCPAKAGHPVIRAVDFSLNCICGGYWIARFRDPHCTSAMGAPRGR